VRRRFINEEQSQRPAFDNSLFRRLIVNLSSDMRPRRQPERRTSREFDEAVPWCPTPNTLPCFLNRKECRPHDTAVPRHVFHGSYAPLGGEAWINHAEFDLLSLSGIDSPFVELT